MVNGALLMAQIVDLYLHYNWETDKDAVHNKQQPIYENVVGEHFGSSYSKNKPWNTLPQAACSLGYPTATERL